MKLYMIEPEVPGQIGEDTVYKNYDNIIKKGELPIITYMHLVLDGWLGDDILEVTPCFIVTERLKELISSKELTGCEFQEIKLSVSDEFKELYPNRELPKFYRMLPKGIISILGETYSNWNGMDFSLSEKSYLVLSEKAKDILSSLNIINSDITELSAAIH